MRSSFGFVRVYSPCDSAEQRDDGFVELSPSTHLCANMQRNSSALCVLAHCTAGKRPHFGDSTMKTHCTRWQSHNVWPKASVKVATNAKQVICTNIYIYVYIYI